MAGTRPFKSVPYSDKTRIIEQDKEIEELQDALEESVKLQSHYAEVLNSFDGGKRLTFENAASWTARLREIKR